MHRPLLSVESHIIETTPGPYCIDRSLSSDLQAAAQVSFKDSNKYFRNHKHTNCGCTLCHLYCHSMHG
jgi:hypothetical protein